MKMVEHERMRNQVPNYAAELQLERLLRSTFADISTEPLILGVLAASAGGTSVLFPRVLVRTVLKGTSVTAGGARNCQNM